MNKLEEIVTEAHAKIDAIYETILTEDELLYFKSAEFKIKKSGQQEKLAEIIQTALFKAFEYLGDDGTLEEINEFSEMLMRGDI